MLRKESLPANVAMLSNLRFYVLASDAEREYLVLDLVSRSRQGTPVKQVVDASFLLGGVDIIPWKSDDETETRVTLEARYTGYEEVFEDSVTVRMHPDPEGTEETVVSMCDR
jgi:hypothetical protein